MQLSQKAQYALRAILELARNAGGGPLKTADIAHAQAIPLRFLEIILHELRRAGFVQSQRGRHGGYQLRETPAALTVGQVLAVMEGPTRLVECGVHRGDGECPLRSNCVFMPLWERVHDAVTDVFDSTTFQDLLAWERDRDQGQQIHYAI